MEIKTNVGNGKMVPENQIYSLKWNDFERQLLLSFANLYVTKEFADCTLICDGILFPAHKIVLSMSSPYFRQILREHSVKHPTVIIDGITSMNLNHVLEFIYTGSVSVKEHQIQDFIETAEYLCVDGIETPSDKGPQRPSSNRAPEPIVSALNLKRRPHPSSKPPQGQVSNSSYLPAIEEATKSNQAVPNPFSQFVHSTASILPVQVPLTVPSNAASSTTSISIPSPIQNKNLIPNQSKTPQSQPLNLAKRLVGKSRVPTSLLKNPLVEDNNNNHQQQKVSQKGVSTMEPVRLSNSPGQYQLSIKTVEPNIQLFTTPSGMIVTTAYGLKPTTNWLGVQPPDDNSGESSNGSLIIPETSPITSSVLEYRRNSCNTSFNSSGCSSQLKSNEDDSMSHQSSNSSDHQYLIPTSTANSIERVKQQHPASHQMALLAANRLRSGKTVPSSVVLTDRWACSTSGSPNFLSSPQPLKYTAAQVRALVDSVTNVSGPFVPCKLCDKVVKRERLRAHIYECHLVNGQKITCPVCGVGLKSKGSYRVHVWRHRKGSLKNPTYNNKMKIRQS